MDLYRCHDYPRLVARWRRVAKSCGLPLQTLAHGGEYPVHFLATREQTDRTVYVSAGIHGDEPASTEGLITWAERRLPALARGGKLPFLLLPCLNPWGLVHNRRSDARGRDLNRLFDRHRVAPVGELMRLVTGRRFSLALHLHEDYDARGAYIYELTSAPAPWGYDLLAGCRRAIAPDGRRRIDGRPFKDGLFLRRQTRRIPEHPEALYLYPARCQRVLTFETPSEFALARRVQAHVLLLEGCVRRLLAAAPTASP